MLGGLGGSRRSGFLETFSLGKKGNGNCKRRQGRIGLKVSGKGLWLDTKFAPNHNNTRGDSQVAEPRASSRGEVFEEGEGVSPIYWWQGTLRTPKVG